MPRTSEWLVSYSTHTTINIVTSLYRCYKQNFFELWIWVSTMRKLWSSYYTLSSNFLLNPEKIWKSFDCPNLIGGFLCVCVLKNVSLPSLFCNNSFFCFVHMFLSLFELYSFFVFCQHAFCFSRYACCFSNAYFCLTGMNSVKSKNFTFFA